MKKTALLAALTLALAGTTGFAYERSYNQYERHGSDTMAYSGRLDSQVNRLNRMLEHVRSQVRRYHADWRLRREVDRIATSVNRVNWRYRHGYDRDSLRQEIDSLRSKLHSFEEQLHVRRSDWYRWD
jgi:hypothetical protein